MEWRDCDKDPPEEDGQRVRVLVQMEMEMFYLPSCKLTKWMVADIAIHRESKAVGWKPIEDAESYYDTGGIDGMDQC